MTDQQNVLELLHQVTQMVNYDDLARQDAVFEIRCVMRDMRAMKDCVNDRDIERWCKVLESVLKNISDVHHGHQKQA